MLQGFSKSGATPGRTLMNDDQIISSDDFITMVDDGAECLTESEVRFLNDGGLKYRRMNSPEKSDVIAQSNRKLAGIMRW